MNTELFAVDHGKPSKTLPSHLTGYHLNLDDPDEAARYKAIQQWRRAAGVKLFDCIDGHPAGGDDCDVELETDFVFDNQWNTTDGRRVFDWYESIVPNKRIKIGHYLEITSKMVILRANTCKCGYCGKEYYGADNSGKFCPACLDSKHLKESDLYLLRVLPVSGNDKRPALTLLEAAELTPLYVERQTTATGSRAAARREKQRLDIEADYIKETAAAPELLAALEDVTASLFMYEFVEHEKTGTLPEFYKFCETENSTIGRARAAIAKAKG